MRLTPDANLKIKKHLGTPTYLNKAAECPETKGEPLLTTLRPFSIGPYISDVITEPSG